MTRCSLVTALAIVLTANLAIGQEQDSPAPPAKPTWYRTSGELTELPSNPQQWINCPPLSLDQLKDKGVVLFFFEEQCPTCEKGWPERLAAAERHRDEPVVFIAVNSGNAPQQIAGYLKRNNINWPVIVDVDRSFEKETLGQEISLQNIYKVCVRTANGEWHGASPQQLDVVASAAAAGGKWHVDPADIPDELRGAWASVEIGNYRAASPVIMRAGRKGDAATKAAAKKLFDAVKSQMDEELAEINKQLKDGDNWAAYKALDQFLDVYDGYPMHPAVTEKFKEVSQMEDIKNEQDAAKKLMAAIRAGSNNTPAAIKRAVGMLDKLLKDYPNTEAAAEAQKLLDKVAETQGGESA